MRLEYFQLVDRIVALDVTGRTITVEAHVPVASTVFEGHFPGRPLMPGVLLTEAMAQTAGWLLIALNGFERMPFLAALKEVKLRTFVTPGQELTLSASIEHEGSGFAVAKTQCRMAGKPVCDGIITFRLIEFPNAEFRTHMTEFAGRIGFPMGALAGG